MLAGNTDMSGIFLQRPAEPVSPSWQGGNFHQLPGQLLSGRSAAAAAQLRAPPQGHAAHGGGPAVQRSPRTPRQSPRSSSSQGQAYLSPHARVGLRSCLAASYMVSLGI